MIRSVITKIKRKSHRNRRKKRGTRVSFLSRKTASSRKKPSGLYARVRSYLPLFVILLLTGGFLLWIGSSLYQYINFDLNRAFRDEGESEMTEWRNEDRMTILFAGLDSREGEFGFVDALLLIIVDPVDRSVGMFNVNVDTMVYQPEVGESVPIRNIYNRSVLEPDAIPIQSLMQGVETLLSIKIDRYVLVEEEGVERIVDALGGVYVHNEADIIDDDIKTSNGSFSLPEGSFRLGGVDYLRFVRADAGGSEQKLQRQVEALHAVLKRITSYSILFRTPQFLQAIDDNVATNITKSELIRLFTQLLLVKDAKRSITTNQALQNIGGAPPRYVPIYEKLDEDIQVVFIDYEIGKEQARVEVFNATNIQGLAGFRARWLQNIGVDVIRVGDTARQYQKTTIHTNAPQDFKSTIAGIERLFEEEVMVLEEEPPFVTTGDIIIVLGDNINE